MKRKSTYWVSLVVLAMIFMIVGRANAQTVCSVDFDQPALLDIQCGPSDDVIKVFVKDIASGDTLVPSLFVDIGDGAGPVNQGPASGLSRVTIETEDGSDDVSILNLDVESEVDVIAVNTGRGPDKVSVGPNVSVSETLTIRTKGGGDAVSLGLGVSAGLKVEVRTGLGSDLVTTVAAAPLDIDGVIAGGDIIILGGGGSEGDADDTIVIGAGSLSAAGSVRLSGFESFGVNSSGE